MSSFDQAADRINAAVEKAEIGSEILSQVANGDEFTEVPTTSGPVPSLKKWQKDNMDLISGGVIARVDKAILSYHDYAAASAAAASLPDGQVVEAEVNNATLQYVVSAGVLVKIPARDGDGPLNVRQFIESQIDGVTSNQAGIVAAVAAALTSGSELEWPAGVYVSDGNIPNFWDVTHKGKGVIKRGSTTFMITGGRANIKNVYLAQTGSEGNDGLTVDFPMQSIQKPFDALADMGAVRGRWVFNLASGTYTKGGILSGKRQLDYRITVKGPEVPLNATPLAVFDGATRETVNGLFFDGCADLELRDVKFINYDSQPQVSAGWVAANTGVVRLINVHCDECGVGYYPRSHTIYFVTGGRVTNCDMGILELFGVVRNFKNVTNIVDGFKVTNCTYGLFAKEHCTGHLDFSTITDNVYGIFFSRSCTANASDSVIKRNQYGAVLRNGSYLVPLRIDWGLNTADANTVAPWLADASSGFTVNENDVQATNASGVVGFKNLGDKQIGTIVPTTPIEITGTTPYTTPTFAVIQQGSMSTAGLRFRVSVFGSRDVATGSANLELRVGGVGGSTVPLPVAVGAFRAEFDVIATAKDVQTVSGQALVNGAATAGVGRGSRTIPFSTSDYPLAIRLTHTASGDSTKIDSAFAYSNEPMKSDA